MLPTAAYCCLSLPHSEDKKPCEDTTFNEMATEGKNLVSELLGGAQVGGTSKLRCLSAIVLSVVLSIF